MKRWNYSQAAEKNFWLNIFSNNQDVGSYKNINLSEIKSFAQKQLERFELSAKDLSDKNVWDIGCGPYGVNVGLVQINDAASYVSIDPLIDFYQQFGWFEGNKITLVQCKIENLQDNTSQFSTPDIIFSTNVIDHVDELQKSLMNISGCANKDTRILVSVHSIYSFMKPFARVLDYFDKPHPYHKTQKQWITEFEKNELEVVICKSISIIDDHPDFTFLNFIKKPSMRNLKRIISTMIMHTNYFVLKKKMLVTNNV